MSVFATSAWEDNGPEAIMLAPLAALYALGWTSYQSIYTLGLKKAAKPHSPIICVGSLLAGGAGKSPVTLHIAELLRQSGKQVVISISGYRSPRAEDASLAPDTETLDAAEWGDETAMARWLLPGVPLVVGRDRVQAAEIIHREFPEAVMLMDDGFQHLRLKTDISILIDPDHLANRWPIPSGPYREPRRMGRNRADLVLPGDFEILERPLTLIDQHGAEQSIPARVNVLTSIGRPYRVTWAIEHAGAEVVGGLHLPDHDPLTKGNLLDGFDPQVPIVVTTKDWVKLRGRTDLPLDRFLIARQSVRIAPEAEFKAWLLGRLDGIVA